jgi:phosphatidylserine/phosphatidylglycerophosphate/cardiolipin synthase-like enzyme
VKCTASSTIRVTMAFWDDGRADIADKLVALAADHCDVRVNMRNASTGSSAAIIKTLRDGHVDVATYPSDHGTNIHSKYLLIDSQFLTDGAGYVHRKLVFTGSHNYTAPALRKNDETLLRIADPGVFDAFAHNWTVIRKQIDDASAHTEN